MPRLIRLYKDYEDNIPLGRIANFNNNFNTDLVLKPNSQIALQSIAIDSVDSEFTIDTSNNIVQWSITDQADNYNQFLIPSGDYNSRNFNLLVSRLTDEFNKSTDFDMYNEAPTLLQYYIGLEWQVDIDVPAGSVIDIGYKIGNLYWTDQKYLRIATNIDITEVDQDRETYELGGADAAYGSLSLVKNIINTKYVSKGCGSIRTQCMLMDNNGQDFQQNGNGFILGFVTDGDLNPEDITLANIKYGIWYSLFDEASRRYRVVLNGAVTSSGADQLPTYTQADTANDIQEVMINGDEIYFNIYQNGVDQPVVLNSDEGVNISGGVVPYDGSELYPILVFFSGSDFVSVDNFISTESQYQSKPTIPGDYYPDFGHALQPARDAAGTGLTALSNNYLEFQSGEVANFLGFDSRFNGTFNSGPTSATDGTSRDFIFVGDTKFNPSYFADSFLVELKNITLDSYDGLKETRKNVLAYISYSDADGTFNYEVNNPIFIDLNNKKEILLRNIEANLLYGDYTEFAIQSDATMVLLIKEKAE